jgi:glycosyltransferase involved in cell wall biosynthesis
MHILMLTSSYEPLTGGAETYARLLCEGLVRDGHEVTLATDGSWLPDLPVDRREPAGRVLRLRRFAGLLDVRDRVPWRQMQFSVLAELGDLIGDEKFDVVHANSHETLMLGAMIALTQGSALVASLHEQNPQLEQFGEGRCHLSYRILPVDIHFAASQFYADRARSFGVTPDRLRLVYHGVQTRAGNRYRIRQDLGLGESERLIVCPGRIYARKDQISLARALPAVLAAVPDARLLLAGRVSDVPYARELEQLLEELQISDVVTIRGDYGAPDMPDVYAAADLVVQPSLEEGLGLAAIEAMGARRPVIGTRVVGLSEVITDGHDGLLVPPARPDLLADAMVRLLTRPDVAARLAEAAGRTVAERFSQERMVAMTVDGYEAALAVRSAAISPAVAR